MIVGVRLQKYVLNKRLKKNATFLGRIKRWQKITKKQQKKCITKITTIPTV